MTHTSGIAGGPCSGIDGLRRWNRRERAWINVYRRLVQRVDNGEFTDLGAWVDELAHLPLWSHPGEHYTYGYSYDILGHIIELKSGLQLAEYLSRRVFAPLCQSAPRADGTNDT